MQQQQQDPPGSEDDCRPSSSPLNGDGSSDSSSCTRKCREQCIPGDAGYIQQVLWLLNGLAELNTIAYQPPPLLGDAGDLAGNSTSSTAAVEGRAGASAAAGYHTDGSSTKVGRKSNGGDAGGGVVSRHIGAGRAAAGGKYYSRNAGGGSAGAGGAESDPMSLPALASATKKEKQHGQGCATQEGMGH